MKKDRLVFFKEWDTRRRLLFLLCILSCYSFAALGQKQVNGTVTDTGGEAVIGANVAEKGTTNGIMTDLDGKFSLTVGTNAVLRISYIGYITQDVTVGNQADLNIVLMEDITALDEVVVIGYGTMKKSDLTGSIASANIESFKEAPNVSIAQSLQGSIPGLNVGQVDMAGENPSMTVRGRNSLSGSQDPLIVLDGVIFYGSMVDLNPNDIQSVNLLKDASSTAIYGSRAANGVLIITTRMGVGQGKPVFNYTGSYSFQSPTNYLKGMTRDEYINKNYDVDWRNGYLAPDYTQKNPDYDPTRGWSRANVYQGYLDGVEFDWWDAITQKPGLQNHAVSMQGSADGTRYFISTGYTGQDGLMLNDFYNRWTGRVNFDSKITNWLTVGIQSFVSTSDYSGVNASATNLWVQSPLVTPYDKDGNLARNPSGSIETNPLLVLDTDDLDKRLDLFGNAYAIISLPQIPGLSYKLNFSDNYMTTRQYRFDKRGNNDLGAAYKNHSIQNIWTLDNLITYERQFNDHNINATLLAGREERTYDATGANGSEYLNMVLGYNKLEAAAAAKQQISSDAWDESSLYYMGRLHYGFRNRYLATFTVRRDGFSGFSKKHKFGIFPSGAVAWVLSEESFLKNKVSWLDFLKVRFSYGQNGNRTVGRYSTLAQVSAAQEYVYGDGAAASIGQYISSMANTALTWETTTGINLGLDFTVLDQRLSGTLDYYDSNTANVLYSVNIPEITGYGSITTNIGKIHNRGLEFTVSSVNIKTPDWIWTTDLNFSTNSNKIVSILGKDNDGDGKEDDLVGSGLFIGKDINSIYDYEIIGIYQLNDTDIPAGYSPGLYKLNDLNNDGKITPDADRKILGSSNPAYRFSINNEVTYKQWTLKCFINSVQGGRNGYMQNNNPNSIWFWGENVAGAYDGNLPKFDYWTPSNPDAGYRTLGAMPPIVSGIYRQRSFIRLQDLSLAYRFDRKLLNGFGVDGLKLYFSAKNLLTLTNWDGVDPETGQGYTPGQTPVMKSYTFGIDITF
jgi:TonB-linked SusC/RagA family outer membrane protein